MQRVGGNATGFDDEARPAQSGIVLPTEYEIHPPAEFVAVDEQGAGIGRGGHKREGRRQNRCPRASPGADDRDATTVAVRVVVARPEETNQFTFVAWELEHMCSTDGGGRAPVFDACITASEHDHVFAAG